MTDHEFGDERDPLLVRPFILQDTESPNADPSTQTWPSATTREVRSAHASAAGAEQTQVIGMIAPPQRRYRRRLLVVGGVGAAVVLAATAAAFAALRPQMGSSISAAPDGSPLPAVTGPALSGISPDQGRAKPSSTPSVDRRAHRSGSPSASASASAPTDAGSSESPATAAHKPAKPAAQLNHGAATTARTGTIRGRDGLCLDLAGGMPADNTQVVVFTCNGASTQRWTLATDGTLRAAAKCALVAGDDSVHIVTCDGRLTARWRVSGSALVNAANSKCLNDPSGGLSGTAAVVRACTGSTSQQWTLP